MLKQHVAVIGLGRFGSALAQALYEQGHDVLVIDRDERRVQDALPHATHAAQADATDPEALAELAVGDFDTVVIATTESLETSVLATIAVKDLGVPHVVAKVRSDQHARILTRMGADEVVFPERDSGIRLSRRFAIPDMVDHLEVVPGFGVSTVTPGPGWVGRTIGQLGFGEKFGLTLVGLARGLTVRLYPSLEDRILAGDVLLIAGPDDKLGQLHS